MEDRKGKQVAVLVRRPPFNTGRDGSAVRMALGLEIADHDVTVVFLDEGVLAAVAEVTAELVGGEPWKEYLETLDLCGHRLWAEAESLARFGLNEVRLAPKVEVTSASEIIDLLADADVTISS